ncbi:MAG: nucleotide exchange factor GrpE [Mycobacteriaceae bacterium]|nr:nucleotide exchange factor GrpE [Mycobacteriaceae bacterium]
MSDGAEGLGPDEVNFVDKRRIDPQTGEVREPSPVDGELGAPVDEIQLDTAGLASDIGNQLAERTADLQRLTAEYANYRKRVERDRVVVIENAKASVVTELLGVLDDLDRAKAHGDLATGPLKSVADKLVSALTKQGVTPFGEEGDRFDPTLHEAVQHEGEGHDPVIGTVLRKGYRLGERVLRHALVAVTDGVGPAPQPVDTPAADVVDVDTDVER